jgi:hypothetical protein
MSAIRKNEPPATRKSIAQTAWAAFIQEQKDRHLVVLEVPRDISREPVALVDLLIRNMAPEAGYALSTENVADGTRVLCAFANPTDVDNLVQATNAQEENIHSGWASEYHCRLDETSANAIDATPIRRDT